MNRILPVTALLIVSVMLHPAASYGLSPQQQTGAVSYADQIRPILQQHCYRCHAADNAESGLRLDRRTAAFTGGDLGVAIVPSEPEKSGLLERITSSDDERMPPDKPPLSASEIALIRAWIEQGASWPEDSDDADDPFRNHWAWQPLNRPQPPQVANSARSDNEIDAFIVQQHQAAGISPSPIASRPVLIRRLFLDLTGLPPSAEQWGYWTALDADDWYEQLLDALLASPHYGERWGRIWLDQARYADSDGYEKDRPRPNAWLYRDWVINALNADLPYDQFSIQQLAGDLLPDGTPLMASATGFHRNTLTNREGGIDPEEDRVKQTVDRLNTTFTVWMGLTVQCAQCHTHKYDPISQREYYQLYSFFNDADETDLTLDSTPDQQQAFEQALAKHEHSDLQLQKRLNAEKRRLHDNQPELVARLIERYPDGVATAPTNGLSAHLSFDTQQPLTNKASHPSATAATFQGPGSLTLVPRAAASETGDQALVLDGSGQHLQLPDAPQFSSDQSFTCSAWIRPLDNLGAILTKIDEPRDFRGIDFTNNRGLLEVHLVDKWSTSGIKVTPATARLENNKWQHVAFTYDGSSKASGVVIYLDGKAVELTVHNDTLAGNFDVAEPWRVGRRKSGTFLQGALDNIRIYERKLEPAEIALLAGDSQVLAEALHIAAVPADRRTEQQAARLLDYLVASDSAAASVRAELQTLQQNPPKVEQHTAMALKQRAEPRTTNVHIRGEFLDKGVEVQPGTPAFLPSLQPRNGRPDRLDLARWMFQPNNPLTPRVYVNRVWQVYFGRGLVNTDNDFGTQGDPPSHPELLDWLASYLIDHNWSMKQLHRHILLSATYRQRSDYRVDLAEVDPDNTLLAMQRRLRVSAETVRDLALSASGLLDRRISGPSVFPPLPAGTIELAFVDVINRGPWQVSEGSDKYRRGLYTFFQRTSPYPMLMTFDAPDSNVTCTRREKSNTPLQALTLWNDSVFMECALSLGLELTRVDGTASDRVEQAFIRCLSRTPAPVESEVVQQLFRSSLAAFESDPEATALALSQVTIPEGSSRAELAAWGSVARALLNLDEFITRQ